MFKNNRFWSVVSLLFVSSTHAQETPFKFTLGYLDFKNGSQENFQALDLNMRHSSEFGNAWVGAYRTLNQNQGQVRAGWDRSFFEDVRVQPSLQLASGGFVGGSLNVETGRQWVIGAGFGRTNLRNYVNLNYDPNDSWQILFSYRPESGQTYSLSYIRDNRTAPDQRHFHASMRMPMGSGQRFTADALYKRGNVEGESIAKWGGTLTYDWPRTFVRLAFDPKTNFTSYNNWRLSTGLRF